MQTFWDFITEAAYRNRRNCPYWGDAGAGVLPFCKETSRFLVNHRGDGTNESGTYGIFGGGIFLDRTPYQDVDDLFRSDYPQQHALQELQEETGYHGPIRLVEIYVYKDNKTNERGEPCNFFYANYLGIVPKEFPLEPMHGHEWETGEHSGWLTFHELLTIQPKHFGLQALLQNAGPYLLRVSGG